MFYKEYPYLNEWYVNESRDVYCVNRGKRGPETPVFYNMLYKGYFVQFYAYSEGDFYETGPGPEWMKSIEYFIEGNIIDSVKNEIILAIKELVGSECMNWRGHKIEDLIYTESNRPLF